MTTDDGAARLFVYGTLMMPAVRDAVCGRTLPSRAGTLADFARYRLRGEIYPAIVDERGALTVGLLCEGLDGELWQRLDAWESPLYSRRPVTVHDASGRACAAHAYVLAAHHHARLERQAWSPREFEALHLAAYLARWAPAAS